MAYPYANGGSSGNGNLVVESISLTPATPSSQTLATLSPYVVLLLGILQVEAPFDGTPSFRLGSSLTVLLDQTSADLRSVGQYGSGAMIHIAAQDFLTLDFDPGGSTVGKAFFIIERTLS